MNPTSICWISSWNTPYGLILCVVSCEFYNGNRVISRSPTFYHGKYRNIFFFSTYLFAYSSSEVISYIRARIIYREIVRILPVFTAFLRFFFVGGLSSFYVFIMMILFIPHLSYSLLESSKYSFFIVKIFCLHSTPYS